MPRAAGLRRRYTRLIAILMGALAAFVACIPSPPAASERSQPRADAADVIDAQPEAAAMVDGGPLEAGPASDAKPPCADGGCAGAIVEVDTRNDFACARTREGDVWCWGLNQYGQTGSMPAAADPTWVDSANVAWTYRPPARLETLSKVRKVVTGNQFACALRDDGAVLCLGAQHDPSARARLERRPAL